MLEMYECLMLFVFMKGHDSMVQDFLTTHVFIVLLFLSIPLKGLALSYAVCICIYFSLIDVFIIETIKVIKAFRLFLL